MSMLLSIEDLAVCFHTKEGVAEVVSNLNVSVRSGEVHGIVGESGCGKTVTFLAALGLLPPNGFVRCGRVSFDEQEILGLPDSVLDRLRGRELTYIPQDPQSALNPVKTVGTQLAEPLVLHRGMPWPRARREAVTLLERVGIPEAGLRVRDYPHQLSGGMCQRVLIAMALACRPKLLIADEPTTALDVTVQRQILDLLLGIKLETGMSIVFITHDLGVVAETCDRVSVMYAGHLVETGNIKEIFLSSRHPYTRGLLGSLPTLNQWGERLPAIEGTVPAPHETPPGCRFAPRCSRMAPQCAGIVPPLQANETGTAAVACHNPHADLIGAH